MTAMMYDMTIDVPLTFFFRKQYNTERVNVDLHDCTRTHAVVAWNEKAALFSRSCMML